MRRELQKLIHMTKEYAFRLKESGVKEIDAFNEVSGENPGLKNLYLKVKNCKKCQLYKTRTHFVFGEGPLDARLVLIGEAPGYEEDKQGKPFVGRSGRLLTKIIEAIQLKRSEVYICNILKCRPPDNRTPSLEEVAACLPYLVRQLNLLRDKKVICTLGLSATQSLLKLDLAMGRMRGNWYKFKGTPVMPTYHPAYLLRNPSQKGKVWIDMKKVRECLQK